MASEFFSNSNILSEEELHQLEEAQYISFLVDNVQYGKEQVFMLGNDFDVAIQLIRSYMKNKLVQLEKKFVSSEAQNVTDLMDLVPFGEEEVSTTFDLDIQEEQFDLTVAYDVATMVTILSNDFLLHIFEFEDRASMLKHSKLYLHKQINQLEHNYRQLQEVTIEDLQSILNLEEQADEIDSKSQSSAVTLKNVKTMNQILRVASQRSLFGQHDLDKMRYVIENYFKYQNNHFLNKYNERSSNIDSLSDLSGTLLDSFEEKFISFGEASSSKHR